MRSSLTRRLAAAFALTGVATAAITALIINLTFRARFDDYLARHDEQRQRHLVTVLALTYRRVGRWDPAELERLTPMAAMAGAQLRVLDPTGRVAWEPTFGQFEHVMGEMGSEMRGKGPLGPVQRAPIHVDGRSVGTLVLRLSRAVPSDDQGFHASVNRRMAFGGLAAGLVAFAAGLGLARRVTAPITDVTKAARALAGGHRSHRVPEDASGEVGELARMFNAMADALEREDELRRAFAADIAHEVRTPLTILRSELEVLRDGVTKPTPALLASLHDETIRLGRLVSDLETLASAEAAGFSLRRQPVALTALIEEVVRGYEGRFEDQGSTLQAELGEELFVLGDVTRLRQIVDNLLSNALKFMRPGGSAKVALRTSAPWVELQVMDSGPGIPSDELPRVFDRFFRGRHAKTGGSGVGLAVVAELVRAHGGQVDVSSKPGEGCLFTVRLPGTSSGSRSPFAAPSRPSPTVSSD